MKPNKRVVDFLLRAHDELPSKVHGNNCLEQINFDVKYGHNIKVHTHAHKKDSGSQLTLFAINFIVCLRILDGDTHPPVTLPDVQEAPITKQRGSPEIDRGDKHSHMVSA